MLSIMLNKIKEKANCAPICQLKESQATLLPHPSHCLLNVSKTISVFTLLLGGVRKQ